MDNISSLVSSFDFKEWREKYCWPESSSREKSENAIQCLENAVRDDVEQSGFVSKETLQKIWNWKLPSKRFEKNRQIFSGNSIETVKNLSREVLIDMVNEATLSCLKKLLVLDGTGIPVASAFLRFFNFTNHGYGIVDLHTARFFNSTGLTSFDIRKDGGAWLKKSSLNVQEYCRYNDYLREFSRLLREQNRTFMNLQGKPSYFSPVDVEMAVFMYQKNKE